MNSVDEQIRELVGEESWDELDADELQYLQEDATTADVDKIRRAIADGAEWVLIGTPNGGASLDLAARS